MAAKVAMRDRGSHTRASLDILFMPMVLSLAFSCAYPIGKGSATPALFSRPSGIYDAPFDLVLSAEEGSTIYYTLDGSDPDPARVDSPVLDPATHAQTFAYSGPIRMEKRRVESPSIADIPTTRDIPLSEDYPVWKAPAGPIDGGWAVRALALKEGRKTAEGCASYIFSSYGDACTISMIVQPGDFFDPSSGIYIIGDDLNAYRLKDRETRAYIEFFDGDGTPLSSSYAGIRTGGLTKEQPNKALNVYYRGEYGTSRISMRIFDGSSVEEYKRLILRTGGDSDYQRTTVSDAIAQSGFDLIGLDYQRWRFSVLYLNGIYWGFVNVRDKFDDDYVRTKYGLDEESFPCLDFFNNTEYLTGDGTHYDAMMAECAAAAADGLVDDAELGSISKSMDVDNYLDMVASRIVLAQGYMPNDHNDKRWRVEPGSRENALADGRWRWMIFDLDNILYQPPWASHFQPACENPYGPISFLMKNPGFRQRLLNRALDIFHVFFGLERVRSEFDAAKARMGKLLPEHIARWGYPESIESWDYWMKAIQKFIVERRLYMYEHAAIYFGLTGGLSNVEARTNAGVKGCVVLFNDDTLEAGLYAYRESDVQARRYFNGTSIAVEAVAGEGYSFARWSDGVAEAKRKIDVAGDVSLTAVFSKERE